MRRQGLLFALSLGAALALAPAAARDRALVVGINEYPGIVSGGQPGGRNLSGATPDAKTFATLLVDVFKFDPGDVKLMTDGEATRANILGAFQDWLTDGSSPGDRVVFYYSGHGATAVVDEGAGKRRLTSTIVPSDAQGNLDQPGATVTGMIEGRQIGALLAKLKGRLVLVVADSCHSGSVTRDIGGGRSQARARTISEHVPVGMSEDEITRAIQVEAKTRNRLIDAGAVAGGPRELDVWSAATLGQETFDLRDGSGGIFTQSFAQGLRDRQAAHVPREDVTAGNLLQFVRDRAADFCKNEPGCRAGLTPELQAPSTYLTRVLNAPPAPEIKPPASDVKPPVVVAADTPPPTADAAPTPAAVASPPPSVDPAAGAEIVADATNLFTHHNDFALSAEILPSNRVHDGQAIKFRVTSGEPGTLLIIDVGPNGKPTQIFPNARSAQLHKNGTIRRDAPLTIPDASYGFAFTASHPGPGKLLVLVAEDGVDLSDLVGRNLDFKPIPNARGIIVEAASRLDAPKISPDPAVPNGPHHFAFVSIPYEVLP